MITQVGKWTFKDGITVKFYRGAGYLHLYDIQANHTPTQDRIKQMEQYGKSVIKKLDALAKIQHLK